MDDTGLSRGLVFELVLKRVFLEGTTTLQGLMTETKLEYQVVEGAFRSMQQDQLIDTKRMVGMDYEFTLTTKGLQMAQEAFRKSQYAGAAPVPLQEYCQAVRSQKLRAAITREILYDHLADLVLPEETIQELGAAVMTGGTLFLYGPTGSGKTSIAVRLQRLFREPVYIPYAIEVHSQILTVFDPVVHRKLEQPANLDARWVFCERPFVVVGGELRAQMLEPHLDEVTRIGMCPLQMRANNGILVIDDFGRQYISPRDLLNRWIVPLDQQVDHLALWSGAQFEIPFDVLVVFATNLDLNSLAEEAFIRRIRNKVKIDAISPELFERILERVCQDRGISLDTASCEYARRRCEETSPSGLRACYPRDLLDILSGVAAFEQREPRMDFQEIERALRLYFMR
jgi:predicted ATPase with chaperone activity